MAVQDYDSIDVDLANLLGDTEQVFSNGSIDHVAELSELLTQISEIIDCLLRLSVTLSNPAPHDLFLARIGAPTTRFEPNDVKQVQEMFPNLDSGICQRLGRASTQRRQDLKYRADQHHRLRELLEPEEAKDARRKGGGTTEASPSSQNLRDSAQIDVTIPGDPGSEISTTSYAGSDIMDASEIRVPSLPKEHTSGPFRCPFCFMFISVQTRDEWKKHIFEDLRPYTCIWNDCVSSEQDFHDQRDWIQHMTMQHWRVWDCPFGCPTALNDCRALEGHLRSAHEGELSIERVNHVSVLSSRTDQDKAQGQCPMCQKVEIKTVDEYGSHIGHHLEQLALFALPAMSDFDRDDHGDAKVETEEHKEREEGRLENEPKASGKSVEVNLDDIDTKVYHKDTFSGAGPEVKATSEDDISTKLSKLLLDEQDKLSRKHRENEIKPVEAHEDHFESPFPPGGKPDEDKDVEKSTHGGAKLQSPQKDGQGSTTTVDQPKSLARLFLDSENDTHHEWGGGKNLSRRSKYVQEKKWHCAWCQFGPLDWTYDTHCADCGRPRDQYCRVVYQSRKVRVN